MARAFAQVLARANVSCNVRTSYYHNRTFMAAEDAQESARPLAAPNRNGLEA
ncbi:hypothetical protein [Hymenobacter wooponensis]|uniref:hypothetical protein n=1 Tax=Hymenobacter wooponensis TaxID=1525360 RepID=UPI0014367F48|nr:hypothetical protein [Hymenobacter wooponensis]